MISETAYIPIVPANPQPISARVGARKPNSRSDRRASFGSVTSSSGSATR